jgi:DNA (cytosine-5)-methyltransferase 1
MNAPKLLDLFCCEGGASVGYHQAGFDVYGVDLFRHRGPDGKLHGYRRQRYPFLSHQGDALTAMDVLLTGKAIDFGRQIGDDWHSDWLRLEDFAAIAASPPCQAYSITKNAHTTEHPELVEPTRTRLIDSGLPYVIENVPGAPLKDPLLVCGTHFRMRATDTDGLQVWLKRHRLFESNVFLMAAGICDHPEDILCAGVYGNGAPSRDAAKARRGGYTPPSQEVRAALMGIDWMSRNGLSQSIPPAYTRHVGEQLLEHISQTSLP